MTGWDRAFDNGAIEYQVATHDPVGRLTQFARWLNGTNTKTWNYGYDDADNRMYDQELTPPNSGSNTNGYALNLMDQIYFIDNLNPASFDTSVEHDANGNVTKNTLKTAGGIPVATVNYTWDAKDRLVGVNAQGYYSAEYTYNGQGQRIRIVEKNGAGTVTADRYFVWDGLRIAEERTGAVNGTLVKTFTGNGEIHYPGGVDTKYFYTKDHLGSTREVLDAAGNLVARYDYDPYGTPTQIYGTQTFDFLFTGHFHHWHTGLYLAPYRAYNSHQGRWLSREPLGLDGPNLYHYGFNSPLSLVDRTGLFVFNFFTFNPYLGEYQSSNLGSASIPPDFRDEFLKLKCQATAANSQLNRYLNLLGYSDREIADWFIPGSGPIVNIKLYNTSVRTYGQIIDNQINIYDNGYANGKVFAQTLIHELGHYASRNSTISNKPDPVNSRFFTRAGIIEMNTLNATDADDYGYPAEYIYRQSQTPGIYAK